MTDIFFDIHKIQGKLATGELIILGDKSNPTVRFPCMSGPHGKGHLPLGEYVIKTCAKLLNQELSLPYKKEDFPWFAAIKPMFKTDRYGFGIHPDGNVEGSLGCIAITNHDPYCFNYLEAVVEKFSHLISEPRLKVVK